MIHYDVIKPGDGRNLPVYRFPKKFGPRYNRVTWRPSNHRQRRKELRQSKAGTFGQKFFSLMSPNSSVTLMPVGMSYGDTSFANFETDIVNGRETFHHYEAGTHDGHSLRSR